MSGRYVAVVPVSCPEWVTPAIACVASFAVETPEVAGRWIVDWDTPLGYP
jgi:hypothetical protein